MPTQCFSAQGMHTSGSLKMAGFSMMLRLMLGEQGAPRTGFRVYCRREQAPVNRGCMGGDCGDVDADAASWRPPVLVDERHDDRHLLLLLHHTTCKLEQDS